MRNVLHFTYESEDGIEIEAAIPGKYEVCSRCEGAGTHVNPSIDGHGISAEEWANEWDPEEREDYLRGVYDVQCEECAGLRVVLVPDRDVADPVLLQIWDEQQQQEAEWRREQAYVQRMGF